MSISGHFIYKDLIISQHPGIYEAFNNLLITIKPSRILEIGTFNGGLTLMLSDILDINKILCNILTYDINDVPKLKEIFYNKNNINIKTENIFCNNYINFKNNQIQYDIYNYIQQPGVTLVLCDGGNKISEFNLLSPAIKTNDFIMAHDYAPDIDYFNNHMNNKIWHWHEIHDSDIQSSINDHNLSPYMRDMMLSVAWACFKKN